MPSVGPFQAEILKGRVAQAPAQDTHCNGSAPIRRTDVVAWESVHSLPPDYKCCMCILCLNLVASKFQ